MARPKKEIDVKVFEGLCHIQCTEKEIAEWFSCSVDTIERFCKRTYKKSFADVYKKYADGGKISLRRLQFRLAEKSPSMAIWLGKQYLGQTDNVQPDNTEVLQKIDGMLASIKESINETEQEAD